MALEHTTDEKNAEKELTDPAGGLSAPGEEGNAETRGDESTSGPLASARNLPRSATNMPFPPLGEVSDVTVTLLSDRELAQSLDDIERMNSLEGGPRTPMMSVVHAVIANAGGSISIRDLAEQVPKYWNRPFPTTPYTPEEFMYVTARNSDDLRVNG